MIRKLLFPALLAGVLGGCVSAGYGYHDGYYSVPNVELRVGYNAHGYYAYPYLYGYYPYGGYYGHYRYYGYPYYGYPYGYGYGYGYAPGYAPAYDDGYAPYASRRVVTTTYGYDPDYYVEEYRPVRRTRVIRTYEYPSPVYATPVAPQVGYGRVYYGW